MHICVLQFIPIYFRVVFIITDDTMRTDLNGFIGNVWENFKALYFIDG